MNATSQKELLCVLPRPLATEIERLSASYTDFEEGLEEIRLRLERPASLVFRGRNLFLNTRLSGKELSDTLRELCGGSIYACADSLREGYVTFGRGYRVGVAGRAVSSENTLVDVGSVASLCIRIPHSVKGAGDVIVREFRLLSERAGVLIYSPPGCGKTTALRDAAAQLSSGAHPLRTVVVDSRGELGSGWFSGGYMIDVLTGYPKAEGIAIATRTLSPEVIICDEIGGEREAEALCEVQRLGVPVIASAHGADFSDLMSRPALSRLIRGGSFKSFIGINHPSGNIYEYEVSALSGLTLRR